MVVPADGVFDAAVITLYGVLKFLHILGAAIWLGSNATTVALRALAVRTGEQIRTLVLIRETDRIQLALVSPAVGLLIGTGIWLVLEGGWGFDRFFVFGLSGVAASAIFGAIITSPALKKLKSMRVCEPCGSPPTPAALRGGQLSLSLARSDRLEPWGANTCVPPVSPRFLSSRTES